MDDSHLPLDIFEHTAKQFLNFDASKRIGGTCKALNIRWKSWPRQISSNYTVRTSVKKLVQFTNLRSLDSCEFLLPGWTNMSILSSLKNLTSIREANYIIDPSVLPNLKHLYIRSHRVDLSNLTNLESLSIHIGGHQVVPTGLQNCPKLQRLVILKNSWYPTGLLNLPNITDLEIQSSNNFVLGSSPHDFSKLRRLKLRWQINILPPTFQNMLNITDINLNHNYPVEHYIQQMPKLTSLKLHTVVSSCALPGLTSLRATKCDLTNDVLRTLTNLRVLSVEKCPGLNDLILHALINLEELSIKSSETSVIGVGLLGLPRLRKLRVSNDAINPSYVKHLTNLEDLNISGLLDIADISSLINLKSLSIDDSFNPLHLQFLTNLTSLTLFGQANLTTVSLHHLILLERLRMAPGAFIHEETLMLLPSLQHVEGIPISFEFCKHLYRQTLKLS
jgi:hypothetical protein